MSKRENPYTPFQAKMMRDMLLDMAVNHPEIFERPTKYPQSRDKLRELVQSGRPLK